MSIDNDGSGQEQPGKAASAADSSVGESGASTVATSGRRAADGSAVPPDAPVGTAPLRWQLPFIIAVVAVVLICAVMIAKSHAQPSSADAAGGDAASSSNALNPNQVLVAKAAAQMVQIETSPVTIERSSRFVTTNGTIHFSPYDTIKVSPRVTGRVRDVFVRVGDRVTTGQPLLVLVSSDAAAALDAARDADAQLKLTSDSLSVAERQYRLGTPEVTAARAALEQAQETSAYNKKALALIEQQDRIGGFTDKPLTDAQSALKQTQTQLAQDQKDLALAQKQRDRTARLVEIGVAAQQDLDAAEDTLGKAGDAVVNDQEQLRIAQVTVDREQKAHSTRLYADQAVQQARTNYQQALLQEQAAGTALGIAEAAIYHDLKQAQHDFEAAEADDRSAHAALLLDGDPAPDGSVAVTSPASGVVTERDVNPGQIVDQTGSTPWQMLTIVNSATVYVDAQVYEKDMDASLHSGDQVRVSSDALPPGFSTAGAVDYVSAGLDPTSHTMSVRADLDNRSGLLKDGMYVNVSVDLGRTGEERRHPTLVVPLESVVHDGDNDYVYVVNTASESAQDGGSAKYDRRKVTLGQQHGEQDVVVTSGLNGDERVVTHGALYLGNNAPSGD
jgi:RND family efflux transporter MFP subunit